MKEIWKDIPDYEGFYKISSFGRVKSLKRKGVPKNIILKYCNDGKGYFRVGLYKNKKAKIIKVHQLVAIAFLNHNPNGYKLVVDHKDNNKSNNRLDNLQLISNRHNCSKERKNGTSKYVGVHRCNSLNKWVSRIQIEGKNIYLGSFHNEEEARDSYLIELKSNKQ